MTIPCLTLTQPWASLVAVGAKRIETRSWPTKYRGPLAIHAAKGWSADDRELCNTPPFAEALAEYRQEWGVHTGTLPRGAVLGVVNLTDCRRIGSSHAAVHPGPNYLDPKRLSAEELAFGNYEPGRYAWKFANVYRFPTPIPAQGALGIWRWEPPADLVLPKWAAA